MKFKPVAAVAVAAVLALGACADYGAKQTGGAVLGGAGGALIGSQFSHGGSRLLWTAAGTLLGAFVGSEVGKSLDRVDQMSMKQAETQAQSAPIGNTIQWNNPQTGNHGTITPVRDGANTRTGEYCREFQQTVTIGNETKQAYGTACQRPDGSWEIVQPAKT
ncbi:MAG: glycine zipper 2TM domain-containing protein [Alphaproteobacteria bacterium]|nr:glycine zipper 2TM domain-containing protein [Alphaproteobacteria bacterium]